MIGPTDRERELAVAAQGPGTGMCLALADLELFWENHRDNAPDVRELRMNVRLTDCCGDGDDPMAALEAFADWLGVQVSERYGCHIAQRRFGVGEHTVIIEAHYTPDPDRTHALIRGAVKRREAVPEREAAREPAGAAV
jgi:hypothetical protein